MKKPLVFISYASDEVELADFLKQSLLRISAGSLEVFVAKRDISSGDNPLKVMLDEKLKVADAIIPICSRKAKNTSWVWWESASVWAKTGKIYPLFTNISAGEFGSPLILVVQGKDYFVKDEFIETLISLCDKLEINIEQPDFTNDENEKYKELENQYSKNIESTHNDKSAPAPISIPLVDLELKRVEADPNLAHLKIEFAYDILIHNKSSVPISKIKIRRQIDSNKNKQKLALHGYAQNKLKFFQKDINVLGSKEFKKIHREHSKSYEYAIFTVTYQDEFNKRYKCIFEGDRDSVHLRNCALQDNEAQNST